MLRVLYDKDWRECSGSKEGNLGSELGWRRFGETFKRKTSRSWQNAKGLKVQQTEVTNLGAWWNWKGSKTILEKEFLCSHWSNAISLFICLAQSIRKQRAEIRCFLPSSMKNFEIVFDYFSYTQDKSTKKVTEPKALTKALPDSQATPVFRE